MIQRVIFVGTGMFISCQEAADTNVPVGEAGQ
jgi:hypothetical protein